MALLNLVRMLPACHPTYTLHELRLHEVITPQIAPARDDAVRHFVAHFDNSAIRLFEAPEPLTHAEWHALIARIGQQYTDIEREVAAHGTTNAMCPDALRTAFLAGRAAVFAYLTGFVDLPIGSNDAEYPMLPIAHNPDPAVRARFRAPLEGTRSRSPLPDNVQQEIDARDAWIDREPHESPDRYHPTRHRHRAATRRCRTTTKEHLP